jgi:hypothetical protein
LARDAGDFGESSDVGFEGCVAIAIGIVEEFIEAIAGVVVGGIVGMSGPLGHRGTVGVIGDIRIASERV